MVVSRFGALILLLAAPAAAVLRVNSVDVSTAEQGTPTTLTFVTTDLVDDTTLPLIMLVSSTSTCAANSDETNALPGSAQTLTFVSSTQATAVVTITSGASTMNKLCFKVGVSPYADLHTAAMETFEVTRATPVVSSVATSTGVHGVATTLTFATAYLVNDATRPYVKIIPSAVASCATAAGVSDAIGGGSGQLVYVSATSATLSLTLTGGASAGNRLCVSTVAGGAGAYADLATPMASFSVTTRAPTRAPTTPGPTYAEWTYIDVCTASGTTVGDNGVMLSHATFDFVQDVKYAANVDCWVTITGAAGSLIVLNFTHIEIEAKNGWLGDPASLIYYDYLEMYDGVHSAITPASAPFYKLTGYSERGAVYRSRSETVTIVFKTDSVKNFNGWRFEWYASMTPSPTLSPTPAPTSTDAPTPAPTPLPTQVPPSTVVDNIITGVDGGTITTGLGDKGSIVTAITCKDSLNTQQVMAGATGLITGTCSLSGAGLSSGTFGLGEQAKLKDEIADAGVSCRLCTVTFHANLAHRLTRSP